MTAFLLTLLVEAITGATGRTLDAVAALEHPPRTARAAFYRAAALVNLLIAASLLLTAAILSTVAERPMAGEACGWSGLVFLHLCAWCVCRAAWLNSNDGDAR